MELPTRVTALQVLFICPGLLNCNQGHLLPQLMFRHGSLPLRRQMDTMPATEAALLTPSAHGTHPPLSLMSDSQTPAAPHALLS